MISSQLYCGDSDQRDEGFTIEKYINRASEITVYDHITSVNTVTITVVQKDDYDYSVLRLKQMMEIKVRESCILIFHETRLSTVPSAPPLSKVRVY